MVADNSVLRELAALFSGSPSVVKAVLFGSRARGDCTEKSDYDIAVFGDIPAHEKPPCAPPQPKSCPPCTRSI